MSHDHGDHPPFLQHHFDTPEQQFSAGKLGMWLFLAQEVLFFAGLFCFYAVYRFNHPEVFVYGAKQLDWVLGAVNTVVLLISSLTMAMAVRAAQLSKQKQLMGLLGITFVLAGCFMVVKYFEWTHKYHVGIHFGSGFKYAWLSGDEQTHHKIPELASVKSNLPTLVDRAPSKPDEAPRSQLALAPRASTGLALAHSDSHMGDGHGAAHVDDHAAGDGHHAEFVIPQEIERPRNLHQFFNLYFCLTGLHGIHVLAGMIMIIWLMWGASKGRYNKDYFTPVDLGGLYWHLVDLVWIYLFPLLYLI